MKKTKAQLLKEKKKLEKEKDKQWSLDVRKKFGNKCAVCGAIKYVHAHHIIAREDKYFRHNLTNGIALCAKHHKFSIELSAHRNPFVFNQWFLINHNKQYLDLCREYFLWASQVDMQNGK